MSLNHPFPPPPGFNASTPEIVRYLEEQRELLLRMWAKLYDFGSSVELDSSNRVSCNDLVPMQSIGSPTYSTLRDMNNLFHSAGVVSGGTVTDGGSATVDVTAGTGFIRDEDSPTGDLFFFDWPATSGLSTTTDSAQYVGVDYNGGDPEVTIHSSYDFNFTTDFPLAEVVNEGGTLHLSPAPFTVGDHASLMYQRAWQVMPMARDERSGGLVVGETGTRNVTLSAGALWDGLTRYTFAALDTSASGDFELYYRDGAGGWTSADSAQWPNTQYDDGSGTLATVNNNWYANIWFYLEMDGALAAIYGQGEYSTAATAAEESPPTPPLHIQTHGKLIAQLVFKKSGATATEILSVFSSTLSSTGVTAHSGLTGLGSDDHTQYLLADGTRAMSGDLDMGSQAITSVGNVDGRDVSADGSTQDTHIADTTIHFVEGDIDHTNISNIGTNAHSVIDTHLANNGIHRDIDDTGTAATDLWSANKINGELVDRMIPFNEAFYASNATAAGSTYAGVVVSTNQGIQQALDSGYNIVVTYISVAFKTGTTNGTYTVDVVLRDTGVTAQYMGGFTEVVTGGTAVVSRQTDIGSISSPLGTLSGAATKIAVGWRNGSGSPGALSSGPHRVVVAGWIVPK